MVRYFAAAVVVAAVDPVPAAASIARSVSPPVFLSWAYSHRRVASDHFAFAAKMAGLAFAAVVATVDTVEPVDQTAIAVDSPVVVDTSGSAAVGTADSAVVDSPAVAEDVGPAYPVCYYQRFD